MKQEVTITGAMLGRPSDGDDNVTVILTRAQVEKALRELNEPHAATGDLFLLADHRYVVLGTGKEVRGRLQEMAIPDDDILMLNIDRNRLTWDAAASFSARYSEYTKLGKLATQVTA